MRLNQRTHTNEITHEGAPAFGHLKPLQALRRSVMSCLLWEDEFYEDGVAIAQRIVENAEKVDPEVLAMVALEARNDYNLRHVPLLLLLVLSRTGRGKSLVANTIASVIQRADEPGELLAMLWADGHKMVPAQMRKGLSRAIAKFDEYQLAKYDRDVAVKIRDVLRIVRPKPSSEEQSALWKRAKDRELATPDTWEVSLSAGADKKETFERLIREGRLGYMALLRNLRNMSEAGVDEDLIRDAIVARKGGAHRVFPFRFLSAMRHAPQFSGPLDKALLATIEGLPRLPGKTAVLVDVSASMNHPLSARSEVTRRDVAAALGALAPCDDVRMICFGTDAAEVPAHRGLAGIDAVTYAYKRGNLGHGTIIGRAVALANKMNRDRIIVVTDEQSHDSVAQPNAEFAYMINVGSYKNGVGYGGRWTHIDGFSEATLRFIAEIEREKRG